MSCEMFIAHAQCRVTCAKEVIKSACTWRRSRRPSRGCCQCRERRRIVHPQSWCRRNHRNRSKNWSGNATSCVRGSAKECSSMPKENGSPTTSPMRPRCLPCSTRFGGWINNRNCEMRNTLELGDVSSIAKIGTLLSISESRRADGTVEVVVDEFQGRAFWTIWNTCWEGFEDVASSVPVTADTVPADVESTMPFSTVPASSGRVRAACARLRRHREDAHQASPTDMPSTTVGRFQFHWDHLKCPPPVVSHHRLKRWFDCFSA